MKGHCPKCGSAAKFVSQRPHTIDFSEAVFRCNNPKCGEEVVAEVKFSVRRTPAGQCFSGVGAESSATGRIKADC